MKQMLFDKYFIEYDPTYKRLEINSKVPIKDFMFIKEIAKSLGAEIYLQSK